MTELSLRSCHCCGRIHDVAGLAGPLACSRCATTLASLEDERRGNEVSAALALSALVLYVPAATLPFLRISRLGLTSESSLIGGIFSLLREGHLFVGSVVLLFSIVLPLVKLSLILLLSLRHGWLRTHHRQGTYQLIEHLGRWGMLDVLLVAVMIAFIKLGTLVSFGAGLGLPLFASFVVLSLLAGVTFNPHVLWSAAVGEAPSPVPASPPVAPAARGSTEPNASGPSGEPDGRGEVPPSIPKAIAAGRRTTRAWIWLLPLVALAAVGLSAWKFFEGRGRVIELAFADGRGLAAGNELRHLGIPAGYVEELRLSPAGGVIVHVRLIPDADRLVRRGARFWIVRPQFDVTGASGLETVVGAKYLAMRPAPADAPLESRFVGLEEAPLEDLDYPGGIEIILQSPMARSLRPGLPVHYRHIRIGGVRSIGLSADGGAVETRVYIRPEYRNLIRPEVRFWNASGVHLAGGLTGFDLHVGPAETWLRGGIELGIPPQVGDPVESGHRFVLHAAPQREWLEWSPSLPAGAAAPRELAPRLLPAALLWTQKGILWNSPADRRGWVLAVEGGLLGPADLLTKPAAAVAGTARLELPNRSIPLDDKSAAAVGDGGFLVRLDVEGIESGPMHFRAARQPEDGYLVSGPGTEPQLIAATRLTAADGAWTIDSSLKIDRVRHGAAFVARSDGAILGLLRVSEDQSAIVPSPSATVQPDK